MKNTNLFTSESVSEGHPDKICDQISDAIVDAVLNLDQNARIACETFALKNHIIITGEITTLKHPNYEKIARDVLERIGYTSEEVGIDAKTCKVSVLLNKQSSDIALGITRDSIYTQGAGDQGMMFGYASDENENYMPLAIVIAHKLVRVATSLRKEGKFKSARPDMKSQVTIDYENPAKPRVITVLMSIQHNPDVNMDEFKNYIYKEIMIPVIASFGLNTDFKYLINPTGRFVIGGPLGDTGLTGRKIIVDTYGGYARHGGGSFSGKDPSKVDRSAAYMARYIAKNLVAAGICKRIEIQLSYAIGVAEPISISFSTFRTANYSDEAILEIITSLFDCRPGVIIKNFNLTNPSFKYEELAAYGHFGRPDLDLPWEYLDKVDEIKEFVKVKKYKRIK
ncbi:MAG: methionine adenosyltransferase [Bacilli bacterium]|jgi:S-adenosylmethionine synthetase